MSRTFLPMPPAFATPVYPHDLRRRFTACRAAKRALNQQNIGERVWQRLSERYPDIDVKLADAAVKATLDAVVTEVARGERVQFAGFGTFAPKARPARQARNPRTGEAIEVKATTVPTFSAGTKFKEAVKEALPSSPVPPDDL